MLEIKSILQTEKSNLLEKSGFYVFKISSSAKKSEIKYEIEKLFGVKVFSVNTANFDGKNKIFRGIRGKTSSYKKCFIKLMPGHKIDLFRNDSLADEK